MLGFRYAFHRPLVRPLFVEGRVDWLFAEPEKAGCPIMLFAHQADLHLSRLPCTYRQCVTMFTEEMPWIPARDLEWIMRRGLCEWIGWST